MALFSLGRVSSLPSHLHQVCVVCVICASVEFVAEWSKALLKNGGYARGVVSSLAAATSFSLFVVKIFKPRRGSLSIGSPVQSRWPPFCFALLRDLALRLSSCYGFTVATVGGRWSYEEGRA